MPPFHSVASPSNGNTDDDNARAPCDVDQYVGPIPAFTKLFRIGPAGVYRERVIIVRTSLLPPSTEPTLVPVEYHIAPPGICGPHLTQHHRFLPTYCRRPSYRPGHGAVCGLQNSRGKMASWRSASVASERLRKMSMRIINRRLRLLGRKLAVRFRAPVKNSCEVRCNCVE